MVNSQDNPPCDNDCHDPLLEIYQQNMLSINLSSKRGISHDYISHLLFALYHKMDKLELAYHRLLLKSLLTDLDMMLDFLRDILNSNNGKV